MCALSPAIIFSLFPILLPNTAVTQNTQETPTTYTTAATQTYTSICCQNSRHNNYSSNKTPRQPYSGSTNTNDSNKLSEQSVLCVSCGLFITQKRGVQRPACTVCTRKRAMLTNRHNMQRGQHLNSTTHFWSAKKATSGGQGLLGWGLGPRALPLSHRC